MNKIDQLLHIMDDVDENPTHVDRALYLLLKRYKDELPELDGRFHKTFRQCDCVDNDLPFGDERGGCMDMVIWNLLYESDLFWKAFKIVNEKETDEVQV